MLDRIVEYLVESGVDEGEVDHLVRQKVFGGKSIFDYIVLQDNNAAWAAAVSWVEGDRSFESIRGDIDFNYYYYMS